MSYTPRHARRERRQWRAKVDKNTLMAEAARLNHEARKLEAEKTLNETLAYDYQHLLATDPYDKFSNARLKRDELLQRASDNEKALKKLRRKLERVLRKVEKHG